MNKTGRYVRAALAVAATLVAFAAGGTVRASDDPVSPLSGWTRMRLEASKFFASARTTVERWPEDGTHPGIVRVRSELRYFGTQKVSDAYSARPAATGLPARWMETEPGKKAREVTVSEGGALRLRRFGPPDGTDGRWSGPWTEFRHDDKQLSFGGGTACGGPVDGWALLAHLQCLASAPDVRLAMLTNDGVHVVLAHRVATRTVSLTLDDMDRGRERTVRVRCHDVELRAAPGEPDPSVFGMQGNLRLLIDPVSGALVSIEGRRENIPGTITFRLTGLSTRERPVPSIPWPSVVTSAMTVPPA